MQGFRDETPFKEETVDEPILDLGRSFQLSQNDSGYEKESWEMCEFWKPRTEEGDEEREMLVDEYEEDVDFLKYSSSDRQEASSEKNLSTEWAEQLKTAKIQDLRSSANLSPKQPLEYMFSKEQMVSNAVCVSVLYLDGRDLYSSRQISDLNSVISLSCALITSSDLSTSNGHWSIF